MASYTYLLVSSVIDLKSTAITHKLHVGTLVYYMLYGYIANMYGIYNTNRLHQACNIPYTVKHLRGKLLQFSLSCECFPMNHGLVDLQYKSTKMLQQTQYKRSYKILQEKVLFSCTPAKSCGILQNFAGILQEFCARFLQNPAGFCKILQGCKKKGTFLARSCKSVFTGKVLP